MYKYIIDDETTNKVKDTTSVSKNILEQFGDVDKKYSVGEQSDVSLDLKEMTYDAPTQEEVSKNAENSLQSYKNENVNSIITEYDTKKDAIDKSIESLKESSKNQSDEIKNVYKNVKENASNDAIKRGLARSSIIVNTLNSYDNNMIKDLSDLTEETNKEIVSLNTKKEDLNTQKEVALSNFDIEYAVKLQEKINSINSEIAKAQENVIKYNNEIAKEKAKWEREQKEQNYQKNQDLIDNIGKYGIYTILIMKQNEKFEIARDYFKNVDKETALKELENNSSYKENLGPNNYATLIDEIKNRK